MEVEKRFEIFLSDWEKSEVEIQRYIKDLEIVTVTLHRLAVGHYVLIVFTDVGEWLEYTQVLRDNKERFFACSLPKFDFFLPSLFRMVDLQYNLIESNYVY